jgi:SpoVK/Ycf46/Vps4 family AAA+-type ATPase
LVQIEKLVAEVVESSEPWTEAQLLERKKMLVEAHAGGLMEFMSTHLTLDAVAGHHAAKAYLRAVAAALRAGHFQVIPMGFLVTGPVGTGKTFLLRCLAGEIGIPMVQLKNFRSPWVGETEANLDRILALLEALAPIAVLIDEADTQLGGRDREGDSGVSARVFGRLASFMSDPRHRGRILWFLATARPDLLPVDFKRQGRAEEHIPLFAPTTPAEKKEVVQALAKRLGLNTLTVPETGWENLPTFSGAEWEAILTRAHFLALAEGKGSPTWQEVEKVLQDFLPPSYPEEIAYMTFLAILECTRKSLLPPAYQAIPRSQLLSEIARLAPHVR